MEQNFEEACASHEIPNAVLLATDCDGTFTYSKAFGDLSLEDSASPIQVDSIMWIASCTKLITTIAALQCVEDGKLTLDSDVTTLLPELKEADVLTFFDTDGKPALVKASKTITLEMLLTHSAGQAYDLFNPATQKYRRSRGQKIAPGSTILERYFTPLIYEPGTAWEYSPSIDWAGLMVSRATGMPLDKFMEKRIWKPLGIKDMTFFLDQRPDLRKRMPAMCWRETGSGRITNQRPSDAGPQTLPATEAMGGGGIFTSPTEYLKVLQAVLKNDGTLLKPETVDDMFKPHLSADSHKSLIKTLEVPEVNEMMGGLPEGTKRNWGLGGLLLLDDIPGWRRKGTMSWGGMPNLIWWIDKETGLCGLYATQTLPTGDKKSLDMSIFFEKTMYERYRQGKARL